MYFRCSAGSPIRCRRRSCSACNSISARVGWTRATIACGFLLPKEASPSIASSKPDTAHPAEGVGDVAGDVHVDVADEAEREVVVLLVDPAGAGQAAAKEGEALADIGGDLDAGEQPRHGHLHYESPLAASRSAGLA